MTTQRFFPSLTYALRDSVLARIGLVMSVLALLSLLSIIISTLIAEDISGRANAVNVSGSLRMLSFRTLSEVQQPSKRSQALETIKQFERRLLALERFIAAKSATTSPSVLAIHSVLQRWNRNIRDLEVAAAQGNPLAVAQMAHDIPDFVEQIDHVVRLIEEELESKARNLRIIQLVLLVIVVLTSMLTLWLLHWQLVQPLAQLLQAAKTVSQGSFSARVSHIGRDELGQLGQAFNAMVEEIANMYAHLEDKVEEKTRELTRTNESLELLYRVSQQLSASDLTLDKVQDVLHEVEIALELGHSMICISENNQATAHTVTSNLTPQEQQHWCHALNCRHCFALAQATLDEQAESRDLIAVPLGSDEQLHGILPIIVKRNGSLSREKIRIIETVGHHVSNALLNMRRAEEKHRMAVLEERSVIARELHDSIAQSLSYLKIQVMRLEKCLDQDCDASTIASELKRGLNAAYRELRELITTFRLRIDERGFNVALQETLAEFSEKLGYPVTASNALSGIVLSGNEEMHVIRIIREALSNIERHAAARSARVDITVDSEHQVLVCIRDDGRGFDTQQNPNGHFGLNIMQDRAHTLNGQLRTESAPGCGTSIQLQFLPQKYRPTVS
jgi:two-component system nitrate/nitrite sensor histidine kinase NarX